MMVRVNRLNWKYINHLKTELMSHVITNRNMVIAKSLANLNRIQRWHHGVTVYLIQSYRMMQKGEKPILKLTEENIKELGDLDFEWKYSTEITIEDDKNSIKVQVRVQHENIFSHEDDERALSTIVPKRKKVNTKPIQIDNGCLFELYSSMSKITLKM